MDSCRPRAYRYPPLIDRLAEAYSESWVQCLSQTPHDPALAPIVDPSVSLIPPVNASSSYYDGMTQSIDFASPDVGVLTTHRYSVPPYGFEYSGT
jgi:hypothetical protein